jgi:ketosteroid isomerase-like protein
MSQENVEILGAFYEAFNGRHIEGALQYVDQNVELYPGVMAPDLDTQYVGRQGLREFFSRIATGPWETVTVEPQEAIETEDGRILSVDLWRFRGREGIEIERELPNLFTFRDGLIVRIDGFPEKADALEAAGLSE